MRATDILMEEHRVIEQVLTCLEKLADLCEAGRPLDRTSAAEVIDFLRTFADGCHHAKEEGQLFPAMEARGFPTDRGPTAVMRYEHEEGRLLIRAMSAAVDRAGSEEAAASRDFVPAARAYVELLRQHIQKEDHCLFPMAAQALSATEAEALFQSFAEVERGPVGEGTHEKYVQLAGALAERLGVPRERHPPAVATACGHRHE